MGTFIVVRCIYTRSDEPVRDIISALECCLNIRTVMRIYVDCEVKAIFLCCFDESAGYIVVVRPAGIFCAN